MCTLLAFVDDATSRLMQLRFVASESAFDYFRATGDYLETHGKPVAFYSDKHGIFRVNTKDAIGGDGMTQFGRVLIGAEHRHHLRQQPAGEGPRRARVRHVAGSAGEGAASGRDLDDRGGERVGAGIHRRLQQRASVATPANAKDLHRQLTEADDLDEILAWREERTVTQEPDPALRPDDAHAGPDAAGAAAWRARRSMW